MKTVSPLLMLCWVLLSSCSAPPETGSVQLTVSGSQALSTSVSRVTVTASAADFPSTSVDLSSSGGSWGGLIGNLPVGTNRSFLAQAFDASGTLRFQGQASGVSISLNQTTAVALPLQESTPPAPYGNEAPVLDSFVASTTTVQPGASLTLTASVHDPNPGDPLTFAWAAAQGTFSAPAAATTSWTAPASTGAQTLTLTVTDSQGAAFSVSLAVNVTSGSSTGSATLNLSFNLWPVVSKVSATLIRLDAGQTTAVSALASDADGDALAYQWTASCPGSWTNATSSAASFSPSSRPTGGCNNCRLSVTLQDGRGGQTTGSLNLCVTAASSLEHFPPSFTRSTQSPATATPGQTVTFDVTATDPQASALTFAWTATTGSSGTPTNAATTSRLVWTAPACVPAGTTPSITTTVTNAFNQTSTQSFAVTGLPRCFTPGWASTGSMLSPRYQHAATLLNNGKVLVSGGTNSGSGPLATAELYDPASGTWIATGSMASPRYSHRTTLLQNGKVLVSGGRNSSGGALATAEVYDPTSGTWSTTGSMASSRFFHTTTLLQNGKVLVSAGFGSSSALATAEVYDPASGTWSATGPLASPRYNHTATLLNNGKVLISAGFDSSGALATAEVYDPASGTWSATGSPASPRYNYAATLLNNGKVLVSTGYGSSGALATAEVYDPASGIWSTTGSLAESRGFSTATLLQNGKVLVAAGYNGGYLATAEAYDPASGIWSAAGSLATSRMGHTATLLQNGTVLVSGGNNGSYMATAEIYTP